jgi:hypothetical protein
MGEHVNIRLTPIKSRGIKKLLLLVDKKIVHTTINIPHTNPTQRQIFILREYVFGGISNRIIFLNLQHFSNSSRHFFAFFLYLLRRPGQ